MQNLRTVSVPGFAPEDTIFDEAGNIYTALRGTQEPQPQEPDAATVVRIDPATEEVVVVAEVGGMPLGLEWLPDGRLLVCNAPLGLQAVDVDSGTVEAIPVKGITFKLCNNAHVTADGTIFVSESSRRYPLEHYTKDLIENTATGRLIRVDPDGSSTVLVDGLSFANGVAYVSETDTVLVAETATAKIHAVKPDGSGRTVFAETPGHPDNLSVDGEGRIWVALPSTINNALGRLHAAPVFVRKAASSLPTFMQPKPVLCCSVAAYDSAGSLVERWDGPTDVYHTATGVRHHNGLVAMGSIEHSAIALFDM